MPLDAAGKDCVICGESTARRPRVKDPKGHYYCRECYEKARQRSKVQRAAQEAKAARSSPQPPPDEGFPDTADALNAMALDDENQPAAVASPCPNCNGPMPPGAVLCVNCGYNTETRATLGGPQVIAAPVERGQRNSAWPIVVGVISIVLGGLGILNSGSGLVMAALDGQPGGAIWIIPLLLAAWLTLGGIRTTRRLASGPDTLRRWAKVQLVLAAIAILCIGIGLAVASAAFVEAMSEAQGMGGAETSLVIAALIIGLIIVLPLVLFWPIFLLIWLGRSAIQREVAPWD